MIPNISIVPILFQTTHSIFESGIYTLIDPRENLPEWIQKIRSSVVERFQSLQKIFSSLDYLAFVPRIFVLIAKFPMPKLFSYTSGIGNLTLLFTQVLWTNVESQSKSVENRLLTRIMSIALNAMLLIYFNIYPSFVLASSLIGIASSLYNFYKNRQLECIVVDRTVNFPVDEAQQQIQPLIKAITELFGNQRIPFQETHTGHLSSSPNIPSFNLENLFNPFPRDNSLIARTEHELKNLENEASFNGFPGNLVAFYIKPKLEKLVESIHEFASMKIIEKRKEILFNWSDRFLDSDVAKTAKGLINELILAAHQRLKAVELRAGIVVKKIKEEDANCPICQQADPTLQICKNKHSLHEDCFREYLTKGLDGFLPGNGNRYALQHIDHYEYHQSTSIQKWSHTSRYYSVNVSKEKIMSCPVCRGNIPSINFWVKKIEDIKYGILKNNHLSIV